MIRILDVYEGNGPVDWGQVKAGGWTAAIHKATQYRVDHLFASHHSAISSAGLHHGCYHFLNWDVTPADQASLYRGVVGTPTGVGHFPWVLDYERYNGRLPTPDQVDQFLSCLGTGATVLLYGNREDLANLGTRFIGRVKVWLAEYGPNNGRPNGDPAVMRTHTQFPTSDVLIWQYTSVGQVPGISGDVDLSMWLGTDAEYAAYVGLSPSAPPVPDYPPVNYEEVAVQTKLIVVPLAAAGDPNAGKGWSHWDPGFGRAPNLVGCFLQGPYPPTDGWAWPKTGIDPPRAQVHGNEIVVSMSGGDPGAQVGVYISVA